MAGLLRTADEDYLYELFLYFKYSYKEAYVSNFLFISELNGKSYLIDSTCFDLLSEHIGTLEGFGIICLLVVSGDSLMR